MGNIHYYMQTIIKCYLACMLKLTRFWTYLAEATRQTGPKARDREIAASPTVMPPEPRTRGSCTLTVQLVFISTYFQSQDVELPPCHSF